MAGVALVSSNTDQVVYLLFSLPFPVTLPFHFHDHHRTLCTFFQASICSSLGS